MCSSSLLITCGNSFIPLQHASSDNHEMCCNFGALEWCTVDKHLYPFKHMYDSNRLPSPAPVRHAVLPAEAFMSYGVSDGYYNKPQVTAERFVDGFLDEMTHRWAGKWYKTGSPVRVSV
eukprot:1881773-Amphidinium_carterae.1